MSLLEWKTACWMGTLGLVPILCFLYLFLSSPIIWQFVS